MAVNLVDHHLRVCFGSELVAGLPLLRAQGLVVLDDAVMDQGDAILADMGMGVVDAGTAMGGPAGVGYAGVAAQWGAGNGLRQFVDLAPHPAALEAALVKHGHAGGVIAPVLQALQPLQQDGGDIPVGDGAYDPAHGLSP